MIMHLKRSVVVCFYIGVLIIVGMCVSFGLLTEVVFKIFKILPWVCLVATVICSICEKVLDIKIKRV